MKKILILLIGLLVFAGCSKVDTANPETQADQSMASIAHLYGTMLPDNSTPQTRGVADGYKTWSKSQAADISVKFLGNPPESYQDFVKEVSMEWAYVANVKFSFVESSKPAKVRIGFDTKGYANASWALTGTDNADNRVQTEATVNYANWARLSEDQKRNDVLRTFGQVLGLELEFRHPNFDAGWVRDSKGVIDTVKIKSYWDSQLSGYIDWKDLKTIVLDPFLYPEDITSTVEYDPKSIMTWALPRNIANNIPVADYNDPIITELSEQDIEFIQNMYDPPKTIEKFLTFVEFEYTGTEPQFTVTTTNNLSVKWDAAVSDQYTSYVIPKGAKKPYTFNIRNTFTDTKTRKIVIGEIMDMHRDNPLPTESSALTRFDFQNASAAKNFKFSSVNKSLTYVRINGVADAANQTFDFTGNKVIKELYLVNIEDSKVVLKDCDSLKTFSTSTSLEPFKKPLGYSEQGVASDSRIITDTPTASVRRAATPEMWPYFPEAKHSLSNGCLTIQNCPKLRFLGLEHTRITNFNFSNLPALELVYISSFADYIAGGGSSECEYLKNLITTLNRRVGQRGSLVVQRVMPLDKPNNFSSFKFAPMTISANNYNAIESTLAAKNWDFFNAGEALKINLVKAETPYSPYRLYYKYVNPKVQNLEHEVLITKSVNGKNDLMIHQHSGHFFDNTGRPYYNIGCSDYVSGGNINYEIGLKVGAGPNLQFSHSWIELKTITLN